jgi:hypothetical protein
MMRVRPTRLAAFGGLAALLLVSGGSPAAATRSQVSAASGAKTSTTAPTCDPVTHFRPADFPHSTTINNKWLPLVPGMQFTLEGRANTGGAPLPHTVVLTVTNLTKVIDGVRSVVLWDRDFQSGELTEAELAFHAQDATGRVWATGEYPEEYDAGVFVGAPKTWISGQSGARAGIMMLAHPKLGGPRYLQGSAPAIDFLDCAQVFQTGQQVCVPVKCYNDVLVTDENSPLDPASGHQRKFFAAGVGNVQITAVDDPEGETLVLTKFVHLNAKDLASARAAALKLDRHAYKVNEDYRHTPPAK